MNIAQSMQKQLKMKLTARNVFVIIAIVLILVLVLVLFRNMVSSFVLKAVVQTTSEITEKVSSFTRYANETMQNFGMQIYHNSNVTKLRTGSSLSNFEIISCMRELNNFVTTSTFIDSVYVYNEKMDYIFSTTQLGGNYTDSFFDATAVKMFKDRSYGQSLLPVLRDATDISTMTSITQIYSFLVFESNIRLEPLDNAIMINVAPSWYDDMFFSSETDYPSYFVDSSLSVVASWNGTKDISISDYMMDEIKKMLATGDASGYVAEKGNSTDRSICFYAKVGINDWYYLRASSYRESFPYLASMERTIYLTIVIASAVLIIALFTFVFFVYLPYLKIRSSISRFDGTNGDEQTYISTDELIDRLNKLVDTSIDSKRINASFSAMIKDEMIRNYLHGSTQGTRLPPAKAVAEYKLDLNPQMPVVLLAVSNGTRVHEYLETIHERWSRADGVLMSGNHSVLLVQPEPACSMEQMLLIMRERFGPQRRFVISDPISDWSELNKAYRNAMKAAVMFTLHPDIYYIYISAALATPNKDTEFSDSGIRKLISLLRTGELTAAIAAYDEVISNIGEKGYNICANAIAQLRRQTTSLLFELSPDNDYGYKISSENIDEWLRAFGHLEDLNRYFYKLFEKITACAAGTKRMKAQQVADSVIAYIKSEFRDTELSAQTIADAMNVSYAYLSRIFHGATGSSIASYITKIRLEEAKALLSQTELKVKDISSLVGFENSQYFFVLFKKEFGITPRQYRAGDTDEES